MILLKFIKAPTMLVCALLLLSVPMAAEAAGDIATPDALEQYASELSQCTRLKYYQCENTQRYMDFRMLHPDYTLDAVISYVDIGLDKAFFTNAAVIADPGSPTVLVNKYNTLPKNYVPSNLESISSKYGTGTLKLTHAARVAFEKMCAGAAKAGYNIYAVSAYRSYSRQAALYNDYMPAGSNLKRDLYVARPGYSEHQTGLAVDVRGNSALTDSPEYNWLVKNAHKYGFILRYPIGKEHITGYAFEPWHLRYIGATLATAVKNSGLTYDEYYVRELQTSVSGPGYISVGVTATANIVFDGATYALPAVRVQGGTYFKLRDIAAVLRDTKLCFNIAWDSRAACISLSPDTPYPPAVTVDFSPPGLCANMAATPALIVCGDTSYDLGAYLFDGANYVRLEELAAVLGFEVSFVGSETAVLSLPDAPSESSVP